MARYPPRAVIAGIAVVGNSGVSVGPPPPPEGRVVVVVVVAVN